MTRALRNSSGHHIQARHHLIVIIVIAGQQFKGLEDRALDALGQVFVAEDRGVRLAQPAADRHAGHEGPVRAAPAPRRTLTTAIYIQRIHLHFGYGAPKTVICAALYNKTLTLAAAQALLNLVHAGNGPASPCSFSVTSVPRPGPESAKTKMPP